MSDPEGTMRFSAEDGRFELTNMQRKMPNLLLALGVVAGHALEIEGRTLILSDYFAPQSALVIGIRRISAYEYIHRKRV
jgi:hypothetical protein